MPSASSASISSRVVMPPAAVSLSLGRLRDGLDRLHVGALHQAFFVDVGVEELAAVRLERCTASHGGERQRGLPAVDARRGRRVSRRRR